MNLGEARIAVRERGVAEILDLSLRVPFVLDKGLYLKLTALTVLPALALCGLTLWANWPLVWWWLSAVALFALIQAPFTIAASRLMFSSRVTLREVLRESRRLLWRFLAARASSALLLAAGGVFVVLLPFAITRVLYLPEVTLLEGAGLGASYQRSQRLTRDRVGPSVAVWLALLVVSLAFLLAAEILLDAVTSDLLGLGSLSQIWNSGVSPFAVVGLLCAAPFVATARFLAYIDDRTRREAWDLQVRFTRLAPALSRVA